MAEISYPFNADNATTGAAKAVSESQWQNMAHMWGGDRVDYALGFGSESTLSLPFPYKVINNTTVQIGAGKAWCGGFYYELTAPMNVTVTANAATTGRIDLVVIRVDMAKPAVNLAVRKGVNGATPIAPRPVRQAGGVWELPIYEVTVPANNGTIALASRAPYPTPPSVGFPWNASPSADLMPAGTISYDMDNNQDGIRTERYTDRTGVVATRSMGPMSSYTPSLLLDSNLPTLGITYTGRWRWIAPNTVSFNLYIHNARNDMSSDNGVAYGIRLPVPASTTIRQVFNGVLNNAANMGGYPTFTTLTGFSGSGAASSYFSVYLPSPTNPAGGLDNFRTFPSRSSIYFSGTYEANIFE